MSVPTKRVLNVFTLVMINVIAVDNLRTLPVSAQLGYSLVSYYLFAAIAFFIPIALVAAELATAYPSTGGLYVWVREAFGRRAAFLTIWLQWIYNIVWYPTILVFIVTTMAYLFAPELAKNKIYLLGTTLSLFWLMTLLNCFGMRISGFVSILGAIIGTLIPMIGIAALGAFWILQGHPPALDYPTTWLPDIHSLDNASLFSAVLFGLLGIEMSAMHAEEVKNPQRDYPRALLYSMCIIFSTLVLGSLAIVVVVPSHSLNVVSGLIDAYDLFFKAYDIPWMTSVTAILIILGGLSGVSAWIIGPTKGLLIAARDGCIPNTFTQMNRHGAPTRILMAQGVIFTILCCVFVLSDTIYSAYWVLTIMCAQLALLVYVFMFSAAIKLRYTQPDRPRPYQIPGGKLGIWLLALTGLLCCVFAIIVGFIPPKDIPIKNVAFFESVLVAGMLLFVIIPWFLAKRDVKTSS
jgi:amino acid transporter